MRVYYLPEVVGFINKISNKEKARIEKTRDFFENNGFQVGSKYIKKIRGNIWELRAGQIRVFLCIKGNVAYGLNIFIKKTQKLPLKEIKLAIKRSKQI